MPTTCQAQNAGQAQKVTGWDEAIADAKRKIADLQFTVKTYTRMRESGKPWPGASVQESDGRRANG